MAIMTLILLLLCLQICVVSASKAVPTICAIDNIHKIFKKYPKVLPDSVPATYTYLLLHEPLLRLRLLQPQLKRS